MIRRLPLRFVRLALASFACLLAAGCGTDAGTGSGAGAKDGLPAGPKVVRGTPKELGPPVEVELQLNWFPEVEHGGFFAASTLGLYKAVGIDAKIVPGGPGVPVVQRVATGQVRFGIANADDVLLGRAQDADVVAVMASLQHSPRCIMVHEASGMRTFDDLKDCTLAVRSGSTWDKFLRKRLKLEDVVFVQYPGNVTQFLVEPRFAQQAYVFSEPIVAKKLGSDPKVLMVSDLGFDPYASVLIVSRGTLEKDARLVANFVSASVRGWQAYLADPSQTNQAIHAVNKEMEVDFLDAGAAAMRSLVVPEGMSADRLGQMSAERWQTLAAQMVEIGAIPEDAGTKAHAAFAEQFTLPTPEPSPSPAP